MGDAVVIGDPVAIGVFVGEMMGEDVDGIKMG